MSSFGVVVFLDQHPNEAHQARDRWRPATVVAAGLAVGVLILGACGGSDDAGSTSSTAPSTAAPLPVPTTVPLPIPTIATTVPTTTFVAVTSGARVVVANASSINGAAGRLTDRLGLEGFTTGPAANSSEGELQTTKIYYDPTNAAAKVVADSVSVALGGGAITVTELAIPAPVDSGEIGDASVLVAMGNDIVDKSLAELQGTISAPTTAEAGGG
jgi:hypothetical protein